MFLSPCFEIVEWCQCCSDSCIPTALCRRSTQASIFVCTASAYCVSTGPIFFPWANIFSCISVQALRVFFVTCTFQRSLASSDMPGWFLFVCGQKLCMDLRFALRYTRIIVRHLRSPMIFGETCKLCFFLHLPVTCLRRGPEYFTQHPQPLFFHQEVRERERERASHAHKTLGQSVILFRYDF